MAAEAEAVGQHAVDGERARLQNEAAAVARDRQRARYRCAPSRLDDWRRHYEVDVTWNVRTAAGWVPATAVEDDTRALTMSGFVRLRSDRPWAAGGVPGMPAAFALRTAASAAGRTKAK